MIQEDLEIPVKYLSVAAAAAVLLLGVPAQVLARIVTLECPPVPDKHNKGGMLTERYQMDLQKPEIIYHSWKSVGGVDPMDWRGEPLIVEALNAYEIRAYAPPQRVMSVQIPKIGYRINRVQSEVVTYNSRKVCPEVQGVPMPSPRF